MFEINHASWELYEALRKSEHQSTRITYDQRRMVLSQPACRRITKLAGRIVEFATLELRIPIASFGSTTWKRKDIAMGLEADESYFLQREPLMRGRLNIDLTTDAPPDLAIETEVEHNPLDRERIYSALGFGEIWRYNGEHFEFASRRAGGGYAKIDASVALSFITPQVLEEFIEKMLADENGGLRAFRDWLGSLEQ